MSCFIGCKIPLAQLVDLKSMRRCFLVITQGTSLQSENNLWELKLHPTVLPELPSLTKLSHILKLLHKHLRKKWHRIAAQSSDSSWILCFHPISATY